MKRVSKNHLEYVKDVPRCLEKNETKSKTYETKGKMGRQVP